MTKIFIILLLFLSNNVFAIDIDDKIKSTIEKNPKFQI